MIHSELCKKLKYDHTTLWYIHCPESVLKNETHKILWDFERQDHQIPTRRPDLVIISQNNKKKKRKRENLPYDGFCCPGEPQSQNKRKQKARQVLRTGQRTNKGVKYEELKFRKRIETIETKVLLRLAWILRRVLTARGDLLLLKLQ